MTDEIKKMLEPARFEMMLYTPNAPKKVYVDGEDFDRLKRGFLKLMEQRDWWRAIAVRHGYHGPNNESAELEAVMKGEG